MTTPAAVHIVCGGRDVAQRAQHCAPAMLQSLCPERPRCDGCAQRPRIAELLHTSQRTESGTYVR